MYIILSFKKKGKTRTCLVWSSVTFGVLQKWVFKSENVCAPTQVLCCCLSEGYLAFRQEQLELSCHGRAHLLWALGSVPALPRAQSQWSEPWSCLQSRLLGTCSLWRQPLAISACQRIYALTIIIAQYDVCTVVSLIFLYVENVNCFSSVENICLRRT